MLFILFLSFINAQDCEDLGIDKEFEDRDMAYLFGDNEKLKPNPKTFIHKI